jgi:hypothetical protein
MFGRTQGRTRVFASTSPFVVLKENFSVPSRLISLLSDLAQHQRA